MRYVAAVTILLIALLNYLGVSYASVLMNVTTVLKYGALAGLALFAFTAGNGDVGHFTAPGRVVTASLMLTALVPVMWTYDGWSNLSFMGGEVKDPGRTLPRALILGTASIVAIYLLVNAAYLYLVPVEEMAGVKLVAAAAAERIPLFGSCRRGDHCRDRDGLLLWLGERLDHDRAAGLLRDERPGALLPARSRGSRPRFKTPSVAIWLAAALGVAYVLQNDFAALADRFVLGTWPFYALAVAGVFVLRRTPPRRAAALPDPRVSGRRRRSSSWPRSAWWPMRSSPIPRGPG